MSCAALEDSAQRQPRSNRGCHLLSLLNAREMWCTKEEEGGKVSPLNNPGVVPSSWHTNQLMYIDYLTNCGFIVQF